MESETTDEDRELIREAKDLYWEHYEPGKHVVTSALRTKSGNTYFGINLMPDMIGNAEIHAEPVALGQAVLANDTNLDTFVAVWPGRKLESGEEVSKDELKTISACGVCRELIKSYGEDTWIIIPGDDGPVKRKVRDLLPARP